MALLFDVEFDDIRSWDVEVDTAPASTSITTLLSLSRILFCWFANSLIALQDGGLRYVFENLYCETRPGEI